MERRAFLKQAALTAAVASSSSLKAAAKTSNQIPRRALGKTGEQLSIIGFRRRRSDERDDG